jgi:hypothetical protein
MSYPETPGWRQNTTGETAQEAARKVQSQAKTLEAMCLQIVEERPSTPDEAHRQIERRLGHPVPLYSVRPRFSGLKARGLIKDSGLRRAPVGGCKAIVWAPTSPDERSLFAARRALETEKGGAD